jgi:hypothetical protein
MMSPMTVNKSRGPEALEFWEQNFFRDKNFVEDSVDVLGEAMQYQ